MDVSFIIPVLEDFPLIVYTINSILLDMMNKNISYEILVLDDGSETHKERIYTFGDTYATCYKNFHFFKESGKNGPAYLTNYGLEHAQGKYIIRLDSHIMLCPKFTANILALFELDAGVHVIHPAIALGSAPIRFGYQYNLITADGVNNLKNAFWGQWSTQRINDHYYPIACGGHGAIAFRKKTVDKIGAYHPEVRGYWKGEPYFDIKHWMFDYGVYSAPNYFVIHYPGKRMWSQPHYYEDVLRNRFICAYSLGGPDWLDSVAGFQLQNHKVLSYDQMKILISESIRLAGENRQFIKNNAIRTLDECFPYWDKHQVYYHL